MKGGMKVGMKEMDEKDDGSKERILSMRNDDLRLTIQIIFANTPALSCPPFLFPCLPHGEQGYLVLDSVS